jgi:hypothetical protein
MLFSVTTEVGKIRIDIRPFLDVLDRSVILLWGTYIRHVVERAHKIQQLRVHGNLTDALVIQISG